MCLSLLAECSFSTLLFSPYLWSVAAEWCFTWTVLAWSKIEDGPGFRRKWRASESVVPLPGACGSSGWALLAADLLTCRPLKIELNIFNRSSLRPGGVTGSKQWKPESGEFFFSFYLLNSWFSIWVQFVPFQICTPDKNIVTGNIVWRACSVLASLNYLPSIWVYDELV